MEDKALVANVGRIAWRQGEIFISEAKSNVKIERYMHPTNKHTSSNNQELMSNCHVYRLDHQLDS